jgi:hypothetical protein
VAPLALEVTLSVQQELPARVEEVDKLRNKQVERARYEADMAQAPLPSRGSRKPPRRRLA